MSLRIKKITVTRVFTAIRGINQLLKSIMMSMIVGFTTVLLNRVISFTIANHPQLYVFTMLVGADQPLPAPKCRTTSIAVTIVKPREEFAGPAEIMIGRAACSFFNDFCKCFAVQV